MLEKENEKTFVGGATNSRRFSVCQNFESLCALVLFHVTGMPEKLKESNDAHLNHLMIEMLKER